MKNFKHVGYLGPEGTFSHEAVLKVVDEDSSIIAFDDITSIFESLDSGCIDEAVVPIENSTQGSVLVTLDALSLYDVNIIAEFELAIKHNLLAQKDVTLDDISVICSHPQAIAQCRNYINSISKTVHAMSSTANAARYVCELSTAAVIGSSVLKQKYGLEFLERNIQDYDNNTTRFVILSKEKQKNSTANDKTSIILSLIGDKPGGLYEILEVFAQEAINLTKIESRPSKKGMGNYIFFIDMEGHITQKNIVNALTTIRSKVDKLKILGSYKIITVGGN
ncbi:MAG: chorismate mutase [Methanosphaera sp. rholeuAM74]|nr:MAG: chorismate mutase [Methanosphaera sp. rholeuAM74]